MKRDEERARLQEEADRRAEKKKRLDVQIVLQKGSAVRVIAGEGSGGGKSNGVGRDDRDGGRRALVVRTAGVPGLNRILVQMEGSSEAVSVAKHTVALC